jgi:hypothetical protein
MSSGPPGEDGPDGCNKVSEGPGNYHGYLDVTGDAGTSTVTVFLHTERHDPGDIDQGISQTLETVKRLVEAGPAPGPTT